MCPLVGTPTRSLCNQPAGMSICFFFFLPFFSFFPFFFIDRLYRFSSSVAVLNLLIVYYLLSFAAQLYDYLFLPSVAAVQKTHTQKKLRTFWTAVLLSDTSPVLLGCGRGCGLGVISASGFKSGAHNQSVAHSGPPQSAHSTVSVTVLSLQPRKMHPLSREAIKFCCIICRVMA